MYRCRYLQKGFQDKYNTSKGGGGSFERCMPQSTDIRKYQQMRGGRYCFARGFAPPLKRSGREAGGRGFTCIAPGLAWSAPRSSSRIRLAAEPAGMMGLRSENIREKVAPHVPRVNYGGFSRFSRGAVQCGGGGLTAFADRAEVRHSGNVLCLWVSFGLGGGFSRMMLPVSIETKCQASDAASNSRRSVSISSRDQNEAFGSRL
jgi:hypothetical protein